jgi:hypothetical protein
MFQINLVVAVSCNVEEYEKQDLKDMNEIWFINILIQIISRLIMNLL